MTTNHGFGQSFLQQQGYEQTAAQLREIEWGLRFTPFVCMALAIVGVITRQPAIHFALAVLGMAFFWAPAWHPFDRLYNHVLRPLWNGVALPPNPLPRRIACFIGGAMNLGIGLSMVAGSMLWAYVLAGILIPLQIIVITTHFCVASWMYEGVLRALGLWSRPIPLTQAKELLADGVLVDVRAPHEFAAGHLPDAINVPVDEIVARMGELGEGNVVLYCKSGMRSQQAVQLLEKQGRTNAYNLGGMSRWG